MNWFQLRKAKKDLKRQKQLEALAMENIQAVCSHEWIIVGKEYIRKGYTVKDIYCPICSKLKEGVSPINTQMYLDISMANKSRKHKLEQEEARC